jgi:subtilase family serine protease
MLTSISRSIQAKLAASMTKPECSEADSALPADTVSLSTNTPEPLPDLTPTRLTLNNPAPSTGDPVTMWLTVANNGQADSGSFQVVVRDGIGYRTSANMSGIPKGKSGRVMVGTLMAGRSPWQLTAEVDSSNRVKESNERNNVGQKTVITHDR